MTTDGRQDVGADAAAVVSAGSSETPKLTHDAPFYVAVDENGCDKCGHGKQWTVVCPDGSAIGQSFKDEELAQDIADYMNQGYRVGCGGE